MSVEQNHWSVYRKMLGGWEATVPLRADAPRALLDWVVEIIDAGFRTEVARFRKEDGTYWQRDELVRWLERGLAERQVVDAFAFARRFDRVGSKIAYADERGITEGLIDDVGGLLRRLRGPEIGEQTYASRTCAPLWIGGHAINFDPAWTGPMSAAHLPSTSVKIVFECDIWLPWVPGYFDPSDRENFYDNRPLAERHTPRLNEFLAAVRAASASRGGGWEVVRLSERPWLPRMLVDDGIDLAATAPLMTEER